MEKIIGVCLCCIISTSAMAQKIKKVNYQLELISHPLCPFNQRCIITLEEKGLKQDIDYKVTYIDLANIPDWFLKLSPDRAMPILRINNDTIIKRAVIINEFLDEITAGSILSKNPLRKAQQREWIEKALIHLNNMRDVYITQDKLALEIAINKLFESLNSLEKKLLNQGNILFNDDFTMISSAYAPFFRLFSEYEVLWEDGRWNEYPKTKEWGETLLKHQSVINSECPDYRREFNHFFATMGSFFPKYKN